MSKAHKPIDENAQVIGQVLFAFAHNLNASDILPILQKHGLTELHEKQWYSVKAVVDFFNDLSEQTNAMFNLVSIGVKIATYCIVPPDIDVMPFSSFLEIIDEIYHMQHQGEVGHLITRSISERHYTVASNTPYPDDFWYGIYFGWGRRLLPEGTLITEWYDEEESRQDYGGKQTLIHIEWE